MGDVKVCNNGIVKVNGIPICKRVMAPDGVIRLQVKAKTNCRLAKATGGTAEVSLSEFVEAVEGKSKTP